MRIHLLESPQKRIRTAIERRGSIEDGAAREQRKLLSQLRREVMREMSAAQDYKLFRLQTILSTIDAEIRKGEPDAARAAGDAVRDAWETAGDMVADISADDGLYGLSDSLLRSVVETTSHETIAVWSELGNALKRQVRRATLGVSDPFEAMGKVARLLSDEGSYTAAFNRSERIIRTEVNRSFAMSTQKRGTEADARLAATGERLMKYWLSAEDSRTRPTHDEAANQYTKDSPIPMDEVFIVGADKLLYPIDPGGSAEETINCRCVQVPVVVSAEAYEAFEKAA